MKHLSGLTELKNIEMYKYAKNKYIRIYTKTETRGEKLKQKQRLPSMMMIEQIISDIFIPSVLSALVITHLVTMWIRL